ncbi:MAG: hypothetical protein DRI75_05270 [Bacteroidetes bacterium]|nr:MAG: hypothetical protein DRI75_05270 [Bacteroidota bacterium]
MIMKNKRLIAIVLTVAVILLIPFIAMQFTNEVDWTRSDFVIAGGILLGIGLLIDLVLRKLSTSKYKVPIIIAIVILFLLIWAELGVGIFGTPFAGN